MIENVEMSITYRYRDADLFASLQLALIWRRRLRCRHGMGDAALTMTPWPPLGYVGGSVEVRHCRAGRPMYGSSRGAAARARFTSVHDPARRDALNHFQ